MVADQVLNVSELFYSIQGESTRAGLPCFFIRLAGCNLRCSYCDSEYTWEEAGKQMTVGDILAEVDRYPDCIVELTGGEPLLQEAIYPLIDILLQKGRTVLVETNGSLGIEKIPGKATVILDIKCPDSEMDSSMNWANILQLSKRSESGSQDEIKFVLCSQNDFIWAKNIVEKQRLDTIAPVLFSPVEQTFTAQALANRILEHNLPVRLQLQLHRILWPDRDRGV